MKNNLERDFAARLLTARDALGLTQVQLADRANLPGTAISHFEAGTRKPSFDSLRKLAIALDVSTDWLLCRTDDRTGAGIGDQLYRDFQKLTAGDREAARAVIAALATKSKK